MAAKLTPAENLVSKLNASMQLQQTGIPAMVQSNNENNNNQQSSNSMQNSPIINSQNSPNLLLNSPAPPSSSSTFTDEKLSSSILSQFQEWQKSSTLVDCQIIIKNGSPIKAHKLVLAKSCNFFCTAFQSQNFKNQTSLDSLPSIEINYISEKGFQAILDYCYTGKLTLVSENAGDVLVASSYLQVPAKVIEFCAKFYEKIQPKKNNNNVQQFGIMNPPTTPPAPPASNNNNNLMSLLQNLIAKNNVGNNEPSVNSTSNNLTNLMNMLNNNTSNNGNGLILQNLLNRNETSPIVQQSDSGKFLKKYSFCMLFPIINHFTNKLIF